jgi:hypothetical protein
MRSKFLPLIIVLLLSAPLYAVYAQDPPPPAKDYFPTTWAEYSFPDGKFRIKFPQKPAESTSTEDRYEVHTIEYKGLIAYRVSYADFSAAIDDPKKVREMLQALKTAALSAIQDKGVKVIADREVVVDEHPGVFLHLEVGANEVVRIQWIPAGSRLYTISTTSRKGSPQELEGKDDFEKVVTGFISSFHILP